MSPYKIPACAGKSYRPSNGSESYMFQEQFCERCVKDAKYRETEDGADGCKILARTWRYAIDDPKYPVEWTHDERGRPTCTAFEAMP